MLPTHQNVIPQSDKVDGGSVSLGGLDETMKRNSRYSHLWAKGKPSAVDGKFPSPKHIWFPSAPTARTQLLRFAFAPAAAPKPGLLRDPRAHEKAFWPEAPATLRGGRAEAAGASPSLSTPPACLTKAPCQPEA